MAESFSFELKLVDEVSRNAKKAADSLRGVEAQAKKAQHALDFSAEIEKVEQQLHRLKMDPEGAKRLIKAQKELAEERKKLGKESFGDAFKEKLGFGRMMSAAFLGDILAEGLMEAIKAPLEFFAEGIKEAFKAGAKAEKMSLGARLSLGKEGGEEFEKDVERFYRKTGLGSETVKGMLLPLRNAGFSQASARQALATATDIAAAKGKGGDEGTIQGVLEQFQHMQQRGAVSKKMLAGLLGEAGGTIPEFYKALGKKLRVTPAMAQKMAEEGKVNPQLMMNMVTEAVNKRQGGAAGTGGEEYAKTLGGRWEALMRLPEEYFAKLDKSPGWAALSEKIGGLLEGLDPESENGQRIMTALTDAFGELATFIGRALTPENIAAFATGIEKAVAGVGKLIDGLNTAIDLMTGETLSKAFFTGDAGDQKLADIAFKKKELSMGTFSAQERASRQSEIDKLVAGLTPSERADYLAQTGVGKPAAKGGAKVIQMNVHAPVSVHAAPGEDPDHTHRRMGEEVKRHLANAAEHAAQQAGG